MSKEQSAWDNLAHHTHSVTTNYHFSRLQPSGCHLSVGVTCGRCSRDSSPLCFNWLVSTASCSEAMLLLHCAFLGHWRASSRKVLDTTFFLVGNAALTNEAVWAEKYHGEITKSSSLFLMHYFSSASLRWTRISNIPLCQIANSFHRLKDFRSYPETHEVINKQTNEQNPKLHSTFL